MYKELFNGFLTHPDTLQVYKDNKLIFASDKERLLPLIEYIDTFASNYKQVVVFDKIMGRAAALLCMKANCKEVYSPLGSELSIEVLNQNNIKHHVIEIVPYIQKSNREDMCPMEKLSLDKDSEEFYQALTGLIKKSEESSK